MGFSDKLWDDSIAGPCPDTGLAKLRKTTITNSAMATASASEIKESYRRLRESRAHVEFRRLNDEAIQVTHSITIIKPPYLLSLSMDSLPSSAGLSPSISPCSLTPRERENLCRSNKYNNNVSADAKKKSEKSPRAEPRRPTVYDWVVFSALEGCRVNYLGDLHTVHFLSSGILSIAPTVVMTKRGRNGIQIFVQKVYA